MAEKGYWDNKGAPATKATWDNPEVVADSKKSSGGWYYNPGSGNVDRWWSGTQNTGNAPSTAPTAAPASTDTGGGDLPSYLQNFQQSAMDSLATLKPADTPSFDELKNNLTPDIAKPETISRIDTREEMRAEYGVDALEAQLNSIKDEETLIADELRALTGTEEGKKGIPLNVIQGRITEEERVAQQRMDAVIRRKNSITNELTTKYNVINTYVTDLGLDYGDAVEAYNNDFDRNYKIQSMVTDMSNKAFDQKLDVLKTGVDIVMDTAKFAETVKQNDIDNARANLTTMANAITSGNMTYDTMSADKKLQIQKLEIQSGLPVGTIGSLGISPKDRILGFSSDNSEAWVIGADGKTMTTIPTGLTKSVTAGETKIANKTAIIGEIKAAATHGETLETLLATYTGTEVTPTEIYNIYNATSIKGQGGYGPADTKNWTPEKLQQYGIDVKSTGKEPMVITNKDGTVTTIPQ